MTLNWTWWYDYDLKGLLDVVDEQNVDGMTEYLCSFEDQHVEWLYLKPKHEAVVVYEEYMKRNRADAAMIETVKNYDDWIKSACKIESD